MDIKERVAVMMIMMAQSGRFELIMKAGMIPFFSGVST